MAVVIQAGSDTSVRSTTCLRGLGSTFAHIGPDPFFRWFCLEPDGEAAIAAPQGRTGHVCVCHRLRPSGPSFRALVVLELELDCNEHIVAASMGIDRTFIANGRIRPFARDIAASFLRWALPQPYLSLLSADLEEIGRFCDGDCAVIAPRHYVITSWLRRLCLPRSGPTFAEVFSGNSWQARRRVGATRILFENLIGQLPEEVGSLRRSAARGLVTANHAGWLRIALSTTT